MQLLSELIKEAESHGIKCLDLSRDIELPCGCQPKILGKGIYHSVLGWRCTSCGGSAVDELQEKTTPV